MFVLQMYVYVCMVTYAIRMISAATHISPLSPLTHCAAASEGGANVFQLGYFKGEPLMPRWPAQFTPLIVTITQVMFLFNAISLSLFSFEVWCSVDAA